MKYSFVIIAIMVSLGCSCKKKVVDSSLSPETASNVKISATLPVNTWEILIHAEEIEVFEIRKNLLEGTTDEYSNKLSFIRELDIHERQALLARLVDDNSYVWTKRDTTVEFSPNKQYVLTGQGGSVNVLTDSQNGLISFINLEGQNVIQMTKTLQKFIIDLK